MHSRNDFQQERKFKKEDSSVIYAVSLTTEACCQISTACDYSDVFVIFTIWRPFLTLNDKISSYPHSADLIRKAGLTSFIKSGYLSN